MNEEDIREYYKKKILIHSFYSNLPKATYIQRFLVNEMLYELYDKGPLKAKDLEHTVYAKDREHKKAEWYINIPYFKMAEYFELVKKDKDKYINLTDMGKKYVESDSLGLKDMSENQAKVLREWISENPFKNEIIIGIYFFIETILEISRVEEQIPLERLYDYFSIKCGKYHDWDDKKTKPRLFKNFKTFSKDLRLIVEYNSKIYLTPNGYELLIKIQEQKIDEISLSLMKKS